MLSSPNWRPAASANTIRSKPNATPTHSSISPIDFSARKVGPVRLMPTPSTFHCGASSTTSTSTSRRRSATASVRPAMPPPTTRTFLIPATLFRLELRCLDDIPEASVVAAHAGAELLRRLLQGLQAAIGEFALDLRIVLKGMNVLHQLGDDRGRRTLRRDDAEPSREFVARQSGLGGGCILRCRLQPLRLRHRQNPGEAGFDWSSHRAETGERELDVPTRH